MNRRLIIVLIILDLIWSTAALIYDYPVIIQTPIYYWPFLIVCPVFPFLLTLVWSQIYRDKTPNNYLLAFAAIPSVIYLTASLIYYPTWMILNTFDWYALGQIFWVAFYGIQAFYLLMKFSYTKTALWLAGAFLIISLTVQFKTKTLGFQDFTNFSDSLLLIEYLIMVIAAILLPILISNRTNKSDNKLLRQ